MKYFNVTFFWGLKSDYLNTDQKFQWLCVGLQELIFDICFRFQILEAEIVYLFCNYWSKYFCEYVIEKIFFKKALKTVFSYVYYFYFLNYFLRILKSNLLWYIVLQVVNSDFNVFAAEFRIIFFFIYKSDIFQVQDI